MTELRTLPDDIFFNASDNYKSYQREKSNSVSWIWPVVVLAVGTLLYYLIYINDHAMPTVISIDEIKYRPELFSGERSRTISRRLQDLGPRVVGNVKNEVLAPNILREEIGIIIDNANPAQSVLLSNQTGSGAYHLEYRRPFINIYENIQNVIVKVEGSDGSHSILVNCHFDTVETSPGSSDDAISCAAMIEIVRVLSSSPKRLKHSVVFLFNGAEESYLQASHLFLDHEWAEQCRFVINLESCGLGGRNILFQSGPDHPWLFKYYAEHAPHPHGQVLGEEMFQNGVIPSDSDFRVFRDFGNMPGMDFAFWRNGYTYHTKYDAERYMPLKSHQNIGENTLAIIKAFGDAPEVEDLKGNSEGKMVYYDYLGWFMISYSVTTNIVLNSLAVLLGFGSIVAFVLRPWSLRTLGELGLSIITRIIGMGAGVGVIAAMAMIVDSAGIYVMPWYSEPWLIFPLYWAPCLVIYSLVPSLMDMWRKNEHKMNDERMTQMNLIAAQIPWIVVLLVLTSMGIRSSSLFFLSVISSAVANLLIHLTPLRLTKYAWIWVYLIVHLPSLMFNMYVVLLCYMFFIPIFGRSGTDNNDLLIAMLSAFFIYFILNFAAPLMSFVKKPGMIMGILTSFSFVLVIIALATDLGLPYKIGESNPIPQRHHIMHTLREFRNAEGAVTKSQTGYFIYNLDRNSPRTLDIDHKALIDVQTFCDTDMLCGLPLYGSPMIGLSPTSHWLPGPPPEFPIETNLNLVDNKPDCDQANLTCTFNFELTGPDRFTLTFMTHGGASLYAWSVPSKIMSTTLSKQGVPIYFLHIVRTTSVGPYKVSLDFKVSDEQIKGDATTLEVGLAGNYIHHEDDRSADFIKFLDKMPSYTHVDAWISAYKSYIF